MNIMKWEKLGKIFDPTEHILSDGCIEFAQSPQALVFDDFVRIYFSTRKLDKSGKFLSYISFVDMDKEFKNIKNISSSKVIELGKLGCFDEHGVFPLNVLRLNDKRVLGFIGGWNRRVSVSIDGAIGLSISDDNGLSFKRIGDGPIIASSSQEPFLVGDPFVQIYNKVYHMWYIYGIKWEDATENEPSARVYKIAHAISDDGINWTRDSKCIIEDKYDENECQALPTVIEINNRFHMYFCYRQNTDFRKNLDRGYKLGYAYSDDLQNWTRNDNECGIDVSENGWDSEMMCYPHLFCMDGKTYMLYNGNQFGRNGFGAAVLI